ncbi:hypothetical protein ACFWOJ_22490 [Streptomyces sp. NPDC058439]|uniref:hypothetical protein n=1 Tax=Streptomyces sp. NPDC058439 TaxID=3346500 RepID=UPI003665AF7C
MLNRRRPRAVWPFVLAGSILTLGLLLTGVSLWLYGVHRMSDPAEPLLVGIRIDGSRISVKAPTCPSDKVGAIEVYDSETEQRLWRARAPKTPEGRRGAVTLWDNEAFLKPDKEEQPADVPNNLDISFEYAGLDDGAGDVFSMSDVKAAQPPKDQYWTHEGPMTARAIDRQLTCRGDMP